MKYLIILVLVFSCNVCFGERVLFSAGIRHLEEKINRITEENQQLEERIAELENPQYTNNLPYEFRSGFRFSEAGDTYYCNKCDQRWRRTSSSITTGCCVIHGPDDCCHYDEELVTSEFGTMTPSLEN